MARENSKDRQARARRIMAGLKAAYPDAHCELNYANPLELLVATMLSAQCSDRQVNIVTPDLFKKYRTAADYADAPLAELEDAIRRIGLYRNKAKNIKAACQTLVEKHGGEVPRAMEELTALSGVGRKTANVVLGNAFGINVGVVVDTHVARLSHRLALSAHAAPEKIEADLQALCPKEDWMNLSHWLIWHGRRRCFARSPDCPQCEIKAVCPAGQKALNPKLTPEQQKKMRMRI
ncbi:MAG TPA: endonuclease III [Verrucomicrobiae bacterium]|jgi:endonuclease-3